MSDILSQNEIDNLLNELTIEKSEAIANDSKDVKVGIKGYNFAKPPKFNKEQLRTLEIIFDNYSRTVSSFLTGYLRTSTEIEVISAEQRTYKEFVSDMVNPIILSVFEIPPLNGSVLLEISAVLGYSIIDRILGGPGIGVQELRDFSEIEKILLKRIVSQMLTYLVEPFENVAEIKPRLEKIETNSQFAQIISPNEMVALVTLKITVGGVSGTLRFCLPHVTLEMAEDKLNTRYWFTSRNVEGSAEYKETLEEKIEFTNLPINVILGKTNITVEDFINLQVGDVIPLDSYINSDLSVNVGNLHKFNGKPGVFRNKNSIQITNLVGKDES